MDSGDLGAQADFGVAVGGFQAGMAHPAAADIEFHTGLEQLNCVVCRCSPGVPLDLLFFPMQPSLAQPPCAAKPRSVPS